MGDDLWSRHPGPQQDGSWLSQQDWLTISDSSNLILRAGRAHIVSYLPPANTRETGTLNNTQSSVISFKSVLQSISFNISINLLLLLARWEERLTDTNSPTDVGIFIRTNNVALWFFFKNLSQKFSTNSHWSSKPVVHAFGIVYTFYNYFLFSFAMFLLYVVSEKTTLVV